MASTKVMWRPSKENNLSLAKHCQRYSSVCFKHYMGVPRNLTQLCLTMNGGSLKLSPKKKKKMDEVWERRLSIASEVKYSILNENSLQELWKTLKNIYKWGGGVSVLLQSWVGDSGYMRNFSAKNWKLS